MPPVKVAGIGSKARVADSFILSVTAAREKRGFTLSCFECSSCYPGLLLDILWITFRHIKHHHGLQKDHDYPKSSSFPTEEVIYIIMAFSV